VVEDKPHKPVKRNSGPAHPLVLPDDDEGAMVTCCGAQENKKTKGRRLGCFDALSFLISVRVPWSRVAGPRKTRKPKVGKIK
jgi:hypothetical protein